MLIRVLFCYSVFFTLTSLSPSTPAEGLTISGEYREFHRQTVQLARVADAYQTGIIDADSLRNSVRRTRLCYKRIAWLVEYDHPGFAAKYFNGAPLLKADKTGTESAVIMPEGLQVIDEETFAEQPDGHLLTTLCRSLKTSAEQLLPEAGKRVYAPAEIIAAARAETVRLPTLGLTGFDTPGSLNALEEAAVALTALQLMLVKLETLHGYSAYAAAMAALDRGRNCLTAGTDFDAFDRLGFLREVTEPLYAALGELTDEAGMIATKKLPSALNPTARSIFSDDFLDPYVYADLSAGRDGPELRALGKSLFYDRSLSASGNLSCASCHQPELAFTDGLKKSASNRLGHTVKRNAPTLLNAVYADRFFYDLRAFTLEQQAEHVIFDGAEFGTAYGEILAKLNANTAYRKQIRAALGRKAIDREGFSAALASYVLSLRSFNSPFDRYVRGETDNLPVSAARGFNLFMGRAACGTCHFAPTFSGLIPPAYLENESEILGVLATPHRLRKELDDDEGRSSGGVHHEAVWIYDRSFKTPTVRNAEHTAPYFHNGAYATLELVVDFYDHGGGAGLGLEVPNQTLPADSLLLTPQEKSDLIAFMRSLSDTGPAAR